VRRAAAAVAGFGAFATAGSEAAALESADVPSAADGAEEEGARASSPKPAARALVEKRGGKERGGGGGGCRPSMAAAHREMERGRR
jgi:hypothetical protein